MITERNPELADPEVRRVFEEELILGEATDTLEALMESVGITQKELAERLGVTPGRVSQILGGGENLTLRSLAALGWALGLRFDLAPTPMADRRGTPAEQDPPAPVWLAKLREQPRLRFGPVRLPHARRERVERPPLHVIDGELSSAA